MGNQEKSMAKSQNRHDGPIFVVGCPRSGNTLLGCILNKHPDLVIFLENHAFYSLPRAWKKRLEAGQSDRSAALVDTFLEGKSTWVSEETSLELERDALVEALRERAGDEREWGPLWDAFMDILAKKVRPDYKRWGDKTPRNVAELRTIEQTYPDAQIVYIYRDPRDAVTSLANPDFIHASDDPRVCAEVVRQYWDVYEREKARIDPTRLYEVRYESLVQQPEQTLRALCEFLNIEFTEALLEAGDPEIRRRLGWADYKSWEAIEPQPSSRRKVGSEEVEALLADRIDELGYERMYEDPSVSARTRAMLSALRYRAVRPVLSYFWKRRYPGHDHFLLHDLPDPEDYLRWLGQAISPGGGGLSESH